jgi:uncharacterized Zn-finger protein
MNYNEVPIALQDQWFKTDEGVTHYCGGSTENKNKPAACQTDETKWFHPTKLLEEDNLGMVECVACQAQVQIVDVPTIGE